MYKLDRNQNYVTQIGILYMYSLPESSALPSATLGKVFAECDTRQRELGEQFIGNGFFAGYFLSGTR
jgi:hypothetical protein